MLNRLYAALAVLFVLAGTGAAFAQVGPGEFTIAALPDTQFYSKSYPQIFNAETKWIADHAGQWKIQMVVGLGDIVDAGGNLGQWQNADVAYRNLDGRVPYMAAIGNHDYDRNNPAGRTGSATNFNSYFGPNRYRGQSWYQGSYPAGSNENFYGVFNIAGKQYLVLVLECFPRNSSLGWAAAVLTNHPGMDAIVVTHAYTYADSTRMDRCDSNSAASFGVSQDNDGQQVWEKLVSKFPNIVMVLSGHVVQGDGTGRRSDLGKNGNLVNQMLSDYQSWPNGGDGNIRLITVSPARNLVVVRTYSPWTGKWLTDSHNQFTLPYKNINLPAGSQAVQGKVKHPGSCTPAVGVAVTNGTNSTVTDANGYFYLGANGPAGYTLKATATDYVALPQNVSSLRGLSAPEKVMLSSAGSLNGKATHWLFPVPNAKVSLNGGALRMSVSTITDSSGNFSFGNVPIGNYQVKVSIPGSSATYPATVNPKTATYVNANLP